MKKSIGLQTQFKRKGFTLVEIMIVITILGMLMAVVLPRMTGRTQEARMKATQLQIETLGMALDSFELDCSRFPNTQEGIEALRVEPPGVRNWKGPYLKKSIPLDPWDNAYVYISPGIKNKDYDLYSLGPDQKEGGGDDIGNW